MPIRRTSAVSSRLAILGAAALTAAAGGCYTEGGQMMSIDRFTYKSTPAQPKTITLVDTRTGEQIWSYDVPVGQRLSMQFYDGKSEDPWRSSLMRWDVAPGESIFGELKNQIAVPDRYSRRLDMKLRPAPELPTAAPVEPPEYRATGFGQVPQGDAGAWGGAFVEERKAKPAMAPKTGKPAPASQPAPVEESPSPKQVAPASEPPRAEAAPMPADEPPVPLPER